MLELMKLHYESLKKRQNEVLFKLPACENLQLLF